MKINFCGISRAEPSYLYYKCDQLEGVLDLLEEIRNYRI